MRKQIRKYRSEVVRGCNFKSNLGTRVNGFGDGVIMDSVSSSGHESGNGRLNWKRSETYKDARVRG